MIQARRIQPQDLDYILKHSDHFGIRQDMMIDKLDHMMLVIENAKICGVGFFILHENKCLVNWVYIIEDYRRGKLGTMLVKTMLSTAEQQGALQAYMHGNCDEFAEFLGFEKLQDNEQTSEVRALYQSVYKDSKLEQLYKVSLIDYFKSCCHK